MLDGLRYQLAVVRELAVDQARRENHAIQLEDDLILANARRQLRALGLLGDTCQLLQRASGHVSLQLAGEGLLQGGSLDTQAVGVGGDHPQLTGSSRDQNAGQDWPRLVFGG